ELGDLPPFLRDHPDRPRPLKPTAEQCYQHSIELAPETLEPYEALFGHFQERDKPGKAIEAGRRLLQRFPEHVQTLEGLADLLMEKQQYGEALGLFQRAVKANPLERRLRDKLSTAHSFSARTHAEAGRFDAALAEPQAAAGAAAIAATAGAHRRAGVSYRGQKTHEKKVTDYLQKTQKLEFTEAQLIQVCAALQALKSVRLLEAYLRLGQKRF